MLKIAQMMWKAMQSSSNINDEDEPSMGVAGTSNQLLDFNMSSKLHNLKAARTLANEITQSGSKLFDFLG